MQTMWYVYDTPQRVETLPALCTRICICIHRRGSDWQSGVGEGVNGQMHVFGEF